MKLTGHNPASRARAFTLIELILVLALLVVITSLTVPPMTKFIRGRALDSETRRFLAVTHGAQSRAVSEGMPMLVWVDSQGSRYGLTAETAGPAGDPKAETMPVDGTLQIAAQNLGAAAPVTYRKLPAIRFLPDGTVDADSALTVQLADADGFKRLLVTAANHLGYEIADQTP